jgi:PAS domain S-box-containing protein
MRTRTVVAVWTLALFASGGAVVLAMASRHVEDRIATGALAVAIGLAFVATGIGARYQRPENRTGVLMMLTGFAWFVGALTLSDHPVLFGIGIAFGAISWGFFAWLVLSFPTGRLESLVDRAVVGGAFLVVWVGIPAWALFTNPRFEGDWLSPRNGLLIEHDERLSSAIDLANQLASLLLIGVAAVLLTRRWRRATPPLRRALAPFFLTGGATIGFLAASVAARLVDRPDVEEALTWGTWLLLLTVPIAFLLGLLRARLARYPLADLVVALGTGAAPGALRDALARALGDPSLEVAYSLGDGAFADVDGNRVELPDDASGRVTMVEHDGTCIAALVHDPSLRDQPALLKGVTAAAGLALQNERRLAALAESEARNRALLDAIPDLIFRIARDGTYLDVQGSERDLVAPRNELLGTNIVDVLPAETARRFMSCIGHALDRGTVETIEYQLRIGPFNRQFEGRIAASGDDEALIIVRDISERKRTEAQLQRLQEELRARFDQLERERDFVRAVVQATPSFLCLVDPQGRIVRFNRTLEIASGKVDDESLRGLPFCEVFVVPEERGDVAREMRELFASRSTSERESHWLGAGGERLLVAWSATPLVDEDAEQRYLIAGQDITQRKQHEEELRRSRARIVEAGDVERRRLERNLHDGAQQRLVTVSLILRLAHAKLRSDPDAAEEQLRTAGEELDRALEDLRELARGIHPAVLSDRGLAPALETLTARAPLPVDIASSLDTRLPPPVEAAAYYVVAEALANVAKYADASGATVHVARDNGYAVVEVADDGVGGADPGRGSGLRGLADRIEALDGRLHVDSRPGEGTRIRAEIPVATPEAWGGERAR